MPKIILDAQIKFLAADETFVKKVREAYAKSRGWSFKVHKKGVGWVVFTPDGSKNDSVFNGYLEQSPVQVTQSQFGHHNRRCVNRAFPNE